MQNASLAAFLHLEGSPFAIPLDASHYQWQQQIDHRGRPRSKVRAGSWSFATSLLDQASYQYLLELMLSPTTVVEARATYGRADGQGTFVTVWGRHCTVSHVFSYFDARGTPGREAGWTLYFTLAAEEMGREAGTAGAFVMPAARSYAVTPPASVAGPVVQAVAVANSGIPPHLPAPVPNPSPDHKQVHLTQQQWQDLIKGRWDRHSNKPFLQPHRLTEFHVEGSPLVYRTDNKGKVVAVYDSQKSYNVIGTRKGYPSIPLTLTGEPTFAGTKYMYPPGPPHKTVVVIDMAGNRPGDFKAANEAAGLTDIVKAQGLDSNKPPDGYTWHHRDDFTANPNPPPVGMCTMELVDEVAHRRTFVHFGACDQANKHTGKKLYT